MDEIDAIGVDMHPRYSTRRYGKKLAEEYSIELVEVQHHWAHAASLMLDAGVDEVVALTLDGTGYGVDGKAWGGEILHSLYSGFERVGSLEEIPLIGGEEAIKDPRRIVFAIFSLLGRQVPYFGDKEAEVMEKLMKRAPKTSSFGRILDALSCYLGICERMTYDGEPAMKLERYLARGERKYEFETRVENKPCKDLDRKIVKTLPLFDQLADYSANGVNTEKKKADLAYSFVFALIEEMVEINKGKEEAKAKADFGGVSREIDVSLVDAKVGDYVMVHAGFAIAMIAEKEAKETIELWKEMLEKSVHRCSDKRW